MKNLLLTLLTALVANICISAQKVLYMPNEWKNNTTLYLASDPEGTATWSETRSKQNDNFIVYWDNGYGDKAPNELPKSDFDYVDIDDLLESAFILGMDTIILCREDCKGLCPRCGADLNEGDCGCGKESDPRLAVLEQLLDDIDQTN